jgi:hypothetical protein
LLFFCLLVCFSFFFFFFFCILVGLNKKIMWARNKYQPNLCVCVCVCGAGMVPRTLNMLGKCSTTKLYPESSYKILKNFSHKIDSLAIVCLKEGTLQVPSPSSIAWVW